MQTHTCHRQLLARHVFGSVELCVCGAAHLTIGAITLRLAPEAIGDLAELLRQAADELAVRERASEAALLRRGLVS